MTNGKSRNKDQYLLPILKHVNSSEGGNEKNMVNSRPVDNMLPPDLKIENEIIHVNWLFKPQHLIVQFGLYPLTFSKVSK